MIIVPDVRVNRVVRSSNYHEGNVQISILQQSNDSVLDVLVLLLVFVAVVVTALYRLRAAAAIAVATSAAVQCSCREVAVQLQHCCSKKH